MKQKIRKMAMIAKKIDLKTDSEKEDLNYWLSKSPQERLQAVTFLVRQQIPIEQKMDRTAFAQRKMK